MAPRLSGQNCKFSKFLLSLNSKKRLEKKKKKPEQKQKKQNKTNKKRKQKETNKQKTPPNIEVCPESLGAMLEY